MLTQLPFHKVKDFKQLNFFIQNLMLIVSIVYIPGCVEYIEYQSQSKVPNLSSPVTPIKASRKNLSKYSKMLIC